jgi:hypothetical protein
LVITRSNWFPSFFSLSMSNTILAPSPLSLRHTTRIPTVKTKSPKNLIVWPKIVSQWNRWEIGTAKKARRHTIVVAILQLPL